MKIFYIFQVRKKENAKESGGNFSFLTKRGVGEKKLSSNSEILPFLNADETRANALDPDDHSRIPGTVPFPTMPYGK